MGQATLGGVSLLIDPTSVTWDFAMKIAEHNTLGGKVIQVFGTTLGDMTVSGTFGHGDWSKGDTSGWEAQERFRQQVETWANRDATTTIPVPLRFLYPPKKWDFQVHVKAFSDGSGQIQHSVGNINPGYQLTLFIVKDSTNKVIKGIKDLYLSRLMDGIGWKQTEYNGPMGADNPLTPFNGSVGDFMKAQFIKAVQDSGKNTTGAQ